MDGNYGYLRVIEDLRDYLELGNSDQVIFVEIFFFGLVWTLPITQDTSRKQDHVNNYCLFIVMKSIEHSSITQGRLVKYTFLKVSNSKNLIK